MEKYKPEVIKQGNEFLQEYYKRHPEWGEVRRIKESLFEKGIENTTIDQLSIISIELSAYMDRLGVMASAAVASVNEAYLFRKHRYFSELNTALKDRNEGITKAEKSAEANSIQEKELEAVKQYVADVLKDKVKAYYQLISSIQTRVGYLKSDLINSNRT